MGEYASTINDLVDANESNEDDIEVIKAKMADIEDRSRMNNVKIRGSQKLTSNRIFTIMSPIFLTQYSLICLH